MQGVIKCITVIHLISASHRGCSKIPLPVTSRDDQALSALPLLRFLRPRISECYRAVEDRVAGAALFTIHAEVGQASREVGWAGQLVCLRAEVVLGGKTRLLSADQEADAGVAAISAVSCSISDCSRRISSSGPWARRANVFGCDGRCSRRNAAMALPINSSCSTVWSRMASLLVINSAAAGPSATAELPAPG